MTDLPRRPPAPATSPPSPTPSAQPRVLAVVPARGGSRGLPGKNERPLCGLPLVVHAIRAGQATPAITRTIVSTDSPDIAALARAHRATTVWFGAAAPLALLGPGLRRSAGVRRVVASTHGHEVGWSMLPGARQVLRRIPVSAVATAAVRRA